MSGEPVSVDMDVRGFDRADLFLKRLPERFIESMRKANILSSAIVLNKIKREKLTGQVLRRRTGNLIRSWAVKVPVREPNAWVGGNGSNAEYAAYQEVGFHGDVSVRAHTRNVTQVFGRPVSGVTANVSAHTRAVNYAGRPYARPSLKECADRIRATHIDQIRQGWEKAQ